MCASAETGGRLGFITPLTHNFCESCNRVRITCTGTLLHVPRPGGCRRSAHAAARVRRQRTRSIGRDRRARSRRKPKGHDFIIDRRHKRPARQPPHERHRRLATASRLPRNPTNFQLTIASPAGFVGRLHAGSAG